MNVTDEPQVTYLTEAQAAELTHLARTRSMECGAMTATLRCAGCDGAAMDGGGPCRHDCHGPHHRYDPARGIVCGDCGGTSGTLGPAPRWWTCGACNLEAPVDDIDLIPGMATTDVELLRRRAHMLAKQGKDAHVRGWTEAAMKIALEIRRELVCCDVYDRLASLRDEVDAARPGWGEAYRELSDGVNGHDICYWGEAGARIAESVGRGDRD